MRPTSIAALTGVAAIAFGLAALPASAAPRQIKVAPAVSDASSQARSHRVRQTRARTRITVHRRSFLDPGTEVLPGDEKYTDYAFPPGQGTGLQIVSGPSAPAGWQNPNWPLPGPFDLPSSNNPMQ